MAATAITDELGSKAPDFRLPATDGKSYSLGDICGPKGTLVMFICNHCPYVRSAMDRIVRDAAELASFGVHSVAISSNDAVAYPDDSFENMKVFAAQYRAPFPIAMTRRRKPARVMAPSAQPSPGLHAKLEQCISGGGEGGAIRSRSKRELLGDDS